MQSAKCKMQSNRSGAQSAKRGRIFCIFLFSFSILRYSSCVLLATIGLVSATVAGAQDMAWQDSGNFRETVTALAVHPRDARVVYAGTARGVFKSADGGGRGRR